MQQKIALRRVMLGFGVLVSLSAGQFAPEPQGARGNIDVTVVNSAGTGVGGAQVILATIPAAAITDDNGHALVRVQVGTHLVTVRRIGCPPTAQTVVVTDGSTTSVVFVLDCFDKVVADVATNLIAVMDFGIDESGTAECRDDFLPPLRGIGGVVVPGNATLTDVSNAPCHVALLLLSPEHAPLYRNTVAALPWTGAMRDVVAVTLPPTNLRLPVRIVVAVPGLSATRQTDLETYIRTSHLSMARSVLGRSFAGIALVDDADPTAEPQIIFDDAAYGMLSRHCGNTAAIRADASRYSVGRINIYYLPQVLGEDGGEKAGYTCGTSDAPEIIFIDADNQPPETLVHEVGHSLGLYRPRWGHSEEYNGAYRSAAGLELNPMAYGLPAPQQYFSVGQVAQMHLNVESWLNRPSATDGSTVRERFEAPLVPVVSACGCPETAINPDCPALGTDVPRSGTLVTSATVKACTVTPAVAAVELCVDATASVNAVFSQGATYTNVGNRLWVSQSPEIVSVIDASITYPYNEKMNGTFTGVAPGTAVVRAYVDGSFAPITVKVKAAGVPPC